MKALIMAIGKHSATVAERLLRNSADITWREGAELEVKLPPSLTNSEIYLTSSKGERVNPIWSRDSIRGFRLDSGTYSLWIDNREIKRGIEIKKGITRRIEIELGEVRGGIQLPSQKIFSVGSLSLLFSIAGALASSWGSNPWIGLMIGLTMGGIASGASEIHKLLRKETEELRRLAKLIGAILGFAGGLVLMYSIASSLKINLGSLPMDASTAGIFGAILGLFLEFRAPLTMIIPAEVEPQRLLPSESILMRRELLYILGFLAAIIIGAALGYMVVSPREKIISETALVTLILATLIGAATALASYFGMRTMGTMRIFPKLSDEAKVSLSLALTLLSVFEILSRTMDVTSIFISDTKVERSEALLSYFGVPLLMAAALGLLYLLFVDFPVMLKPSVKSVTRECPSEPRFYGSHLIVLSVLDDETRAKTLTCTKWQESLIRKDLEKNDVHLLHVIGPQESYKDYLSLNYSSFRKTLRYIRDWVITRSGSDLDLIMVIFDAECCAGREAVRALGTMDLPVILMALLPPKNWKDEEIERALEGLEGYPILLADPLLYVTPTSPIAEAMEEFELEIANSIGPILEIGGPGIDSVSGVDVSHVLSTLGGTSIICCEPLYGFKGSLATVGRATIPHTDDPETRLKDATRSSLNRTLIEIDYGREDVAELMSRTRLLVIVRGDRRAVIPQAVMTELKKVYRGTLIGVADIPVEGMRGIEVISLLAGLDRDLIPRLKSDKQESDQEAHEDGGQDQTRTQREERDPFEEIIRGVA